MVDADLVGEEGGIVGAEEAAAVGVDANAKVSDSYFERGFSDDVGDGGGDAWVDLCGGVCGHVALVVEGYEEDAGDEG